MTWLVLSQVLGPLSVDLWVISCGNHRAPASFCTRVCVCRPRHQVGTWGGRSQPHSSTLEVSEGACTDDSQTTSPSDPLWSLDPRHLPQEVSWATEDVEVTHQLASLFFPASSLRSVPMARPCSCPCPPGQLIGPASSRPPAPPPDHPLMEVFLTPELTLLHPCSQPSHGSVVLPLPLGAC